MRNEGPPERGRSLVRRRLLQGFGAAVGVVGVGALSHSGARLDSTPERNSTGPMQLHWNAEAKAWPARPEGVTTSVIFLSTDDPQAPQPGDFDSLLGDVWWRHPTSSYLVKPVLPE